MYNSYMAPHPTHRLREVPWDRVPNEIALPAIGRVLEGAPAEREVDKALRSGRDLDNDGRRALAEAIFGVALWRRRLRWHAGADAPTDKLLTTLRALPDLPAPPRLADRWSLPDWLEAHLEKELGDQADAFCAAIAVPGPVCLRANRILITREELAQRLDFATRPGRLAPDALVVETKNANLFGSPAWRDGLFEVQDEGSQLVGRLVEPEPGETVLDLCAGAGGKSLLLAAQGARVLAHDIDGEKLGRLSVRAARARVPIRIVRRPENAEHVLVDAPCSEIGTLRRGPDARWRLTLQPFPQREILETAARNARKRIVYVTCTLNRAENEDVAKSFDEAHPEFRRSRTMKLLPHVDDTDGFFAAVWDRRP